MSSNTPTCITLTDRQATAARNLVKNPLNRNRALSAALDVVLALQTIVLIVKETWYGKPKTK